MISFVFVAFVMAVFLALRLCNRITKMEKAQVCGAKWILLVASYIFIGYADFRFALILATLSVIVWFCGWKPSRIKWGVSAALLCLGYFKYVDFFCESFSRLIGNLDYVTLNVILPLGISYYTFSAIGYLVDIQRGKSEPRPLLDVALYLAFFPKIVSGPIQRANDFVGQVNKRNSAGWDSFSAGIQIFVFGLFKKLVLADRLSVFVNQVYDAPSVFSGGTVLLGVLAYSMQIYFDFSGYSDMAIGVARVLGVNLPRNFNLPYMSRNVTELWKRWHISLSSWLQEYVYISLGGNRRGHLRTYLNLVLTMVLGGLWHGPKWTYVIWGLLHGVALAVHKIWSKAVCTKRNHGSRFVEAISIIGTFVFTSFAWIFFRAESLEKAMEICRQILQLRTGISHPHMWSFIGLTVLILSSVAVVIRTTKSTNPGIAGRAFLAEGFYPILDLKKFWHLVAFFVFCGLIIGLAYTGGSPFIYGEY